MKLTNLDKVLFPARRPHPALTKRDLIRHNATMAPAMLPYLADRPVNLHRFPDGIAKPGFWHKAAPSHAPTGSDAGTTRTPTPARPSSTSCSTRRRAGVGRQLRRHRGPPVDVDRRATPTDRRGR